MDPNYFYVFVVLKTGDNIIPGHWGILMTFFINIG